MLVEFRLTNHKSIRNEQTLSMVAGQSRTLKGHVVKTNRHDLLRSVGLFGGNASGKTNILDGLVAMRNIVGFGARERPDTDRIPGIDPFRLDADTLTKPTRFGVKINLGGDLYTYAFEATAQKIHQESLTVRRAGKNTREETMIDRRETNGDRHIEVYRKILPSQAAQDTLKLVRTNQLVLSKSATIDIPALKPIYGWFNDGIAIMDLHRNLSRQINILRRTAQRVASSKAEDQAFASRFGLLASSAGAGISAITAKKAEVAQALFQLRLEARREAGEVIPESDAPQISIPDEVVQEIKKHKIPFPFHAEHQLVLTHADSQSSCQAEFDISEESTGTQRFLAIAAGLLTAMEKNQLVIVDELDNSLHPHLVNRVLALIHAASEQPHGAQMLFTTHDTNAMNAIDTLRLDQIWLCERDDRGASTLFSLDDIEGLRGDAAIAKQYLLGRFGGVPQFGYELASLHPSDTPQILGAP
ncbi:MAG: ATP-binding protein [Phycisphaeraceae bacterium]|nr:ATP-binding protein [Phycisphaeraceae bacterium]